MAKQGFNYINENVYVYQEDAGAESAALGLDNTNSLWKLKVLATAGATPTGTAHITIDPAAAGNITITPNGAGNVVLSSLGVGAVLSNASGVLSSTGASTAGWVLTANGGVLAPTFQVLPAGGIVTLAGDSGTATGVTVTIAGTANQIVTSAAAAQVTVALTSSVIIANDLTLTNGDATFINADAGTTSPIAYFKKNRALAALTSGDLTGTVKFSGYDGTQYTDSARITSTSSGTIANTRVAGDLKFYTHPDSAAADPTLRMTIAAAGNVTVAAPDAGVGLTVSAGGITCTSGAITATLGSVVVTSGKVEIPYGRRDLGTGYIKVGANGQIFIGEIAVVDCIYIGDKCGPIGALNSYAYNTAIGNYSLSLISTAVGGGTNNTSLGRSTLYSISNGHYNIGLGAWAGLYITNGTHNILIGSNANSVAPYGAGGNYTGAESSNVCIHNYGITGESNKMRLGTTGSGTGQQNDCWIAGTYAPTTAIGGTAKVMLVDSADHTGGLAGAANTIFVGGTAPSFTATPQCTSLTLTGQLLLPNTSAATVGTIKFNSVIYIHNYGTNNICLGYDALRLSTINPTSTNNTAVGFNSMHAIANNSSYNTAIGTGTLYTINDAATKNSALGANSLRMLITGNWNTALGCQNSLNYGSGEAYTGAESSNIVINHPGVVGESNTLHIGKATGTGASELKSTYISGIYTTAATPSGTAKIQLVDSNDLHYGLAGAAGTYLTGGTAPSFQTIPAGAMANVNATANVSPAVVRTCYTINHATPATKLEITLPATYAVGDRIQLVGNTAGMWKLIASAGDVINLGSTPTSAGGYLEATSAFDCVEIVCTVADSVWVVCSSVGNITVA